MDITFLTVPLQPYFLPMPECCQDKTKCKQGTNVPLCPRVPFVKLQMIKRLGDPLSVPHLRQGMQSPVHVPGSHC